MPRTNSYINGNLARQIHNTNSNFNEPHSLSSTRHKRLSLNKEVRSTDHGLNRWNERVAITGDYPTFNSKLQLNDYLQHLYDENKIKHLMNDFYLIDDDIVSVLEFEDDKVLLITIYGTQSSCPLLEDLSYFFKVVKKYGKIDMDVFIH